MPPVLPAVLARVGLRRLFFGRTAGGIKLLKIETVEQLGDLFTKGLPKIIFEYLRCKLMVW